jgi:hypothetical protein
MQEELVSVREREELWKEYCERERIIEETGVKCK